ncbi:hypothetical protein ACAD32_02411 [Clavibacter nebraskensis]
MCRVPCRRREAGRCAGGGRSWVGTAPGAACGMHAFCVAEVRQAACQQQGIGVDRSERVQLVKSGSQVKASVASGAVVTAIGVLVSAALVAASALHPVVAEHPSVGSSANTALLRSGTSTFDSSRVVGGTSDDRLGQMLALLESLPEDLKQADPKTTPGYADRLAAEINARRGGAIGGATTTAGYPAVSTALFTGTSASPRTSPTDPQIELAVNWVACATDIVGLIVQYGIPVGKVIGWIKDARAIYGSVRAIAAAIRRGDFGVTVGEDAAQELEGLLGIDGVIADCFS